MERTPAAGLGAATASRPDPTGQPLPPQPSPDQRTAHLLRLRHRLAAAGTSPGERLSVFRAAVACDDWPLVAALGASLTREERLPPDLRLPYCTALWHMGRVNDALEICRGATLAQPASLEALALYRDLCRWAERVPAVYQQERDGPLRLEPLGHHHVRDFAWQYFDRAIAELCCLPRFACDGEWHAWLDHAWRDGDERVLAVLHREWGFVGSLSLVMHEGIGFFYYWLGRDFQGQGFGPRTGALLLRIAASRWGLRACFAKSFTHNVRSRRGLEKMGFRPIDVPVATANPGEVFFRWPPDAAAGAAEEMRGLFQNMGEAMKVLRPLVAPVPPDCIRRTPCSAR